MVRKPITRTTSIPKSRPKLKTVIKKEYHIHLIQILEFGAFHFGKTSVSSFYKETVKAISMLSIFPHANPKNHFIESTQNKTYRNIFIKSYYILYCVKQDEVVIIDIFHQAINPESVNDKIG